MEFTNHITFARPGYSVKTCQDMQGNIYYQEIVCGCINRTKKSSLPAALFYDRLHEMGLKAMEETK